MAGEIVFPNVSGRTLYAVFINAVGQFWNTSGTPAFEAFTVGNIANYGTTITEQSTTGIYLGTAPAMPVGAIRVIVRERAGASPAVGDANIGGGEFWWTGTALVAMSANWNALVIDSAGAVSADVTKWKGTTAATVDTAGYPKVTVKSGTGTGEMSLSAGVADANVAQISGDSTAADRLEAMMDGIVTGNVNDASATTTGFIGNSGLSSTNDFYNNLVLQITSGTLAGVSRKITDYVGATRAFVFTEAFPSAPANSVTFNILGKID